MKDQVKAKYAQIESDLAECEARWNAGDGKRVNDLIEHAKWMIARLEKFEHAQSLLALVHGDLFDVDEDIMP